MLNDYLVQFVDAGTASVVLAEKPNLDVIGKSLSGNIPPQQNVAAAAPVVPSSPKPAGKQGVDMNPFPPRKTTSQYTFTPPSQTPVNNATKPAVPPPPPASPKPIRKPTNQTTSTTLDKVPEPKVQEQKVPEPKVPEQKVSEPKVPMPKLPQKQATSVPTPVKVPEMKPPTKKAPPVPPPKPELKRFRAGTVVAPPAGISGETCAKCGNPFKGEPRMKAKGKIWHSSCFVCTSCRYILKGIL
jgi:hypothetical protein